MSQHSLFDTAAPASGILFLARSSPFLCISESLQIIGVMLYHLYNGDRLRRAAMRSLEPLRGEPLERASSQRHPIASWVLFVVGPLPQAIKLWGMQGIPWTKTWGAISMSSFLLTALVGTLASSSDQARPSRGSRGHDLVSRLFFMLHVCAIVLHAGLYVWGVSAILPRELITFKASPTIFFLQLLVEVFVLAFIMLGYGVPMVFGLIGLGTLVGLLVPRLLSRVLSAEAFTRFERTSSRPTTQTLYGFSLLLVYFGPLAWAWWYFNLSEEGKLEMFFSFLYGNRPMAIISVLLYGSGAIYLIYPDSGNLVWKSWFIKLARISFALANLILPLLYYRFKYEPTGTVKPAWTDQLG